MERTGRDRLAQRALGRRAALFFTLLSGVLVLSPDLPVGQPQCIECHGRRNLVKAGVEGAEISLYVDHNVFKSSVHKDFECVDCHTDVTEFPHRGKSQPVDCAGCHDDVLEVYRSSIHAVARAQGAVDAPLCSDCHGKHDILRSSNPISRTYPLNLASTCAVCHADPKIVKKYHIPIADPLAAYKGSVHGIALLTESNFKAATCNNCHGSHDIRTMGDPESGIYWKHVAETCGKCHREIADQYKRSVHGTAVARNIREAPVCTDCHGEHEVKSPRDPRSPVHPLKVSAATCERCHASELIIQKYGLPEAQVSTFESSYHGLAIKGGSLAAANCASCHGIHNILPSSDPQSTVYPANLKNTCGKCHPRASENFARGQVHLTTSTVPGRVVSFVRNLYVLLIVCVIGLMVVHNGMDFLYRTRRILKKRDLQG